MTTKTYGAKYDANLSVKEIAAKLRAEFKADRALAQFKLSTRVRRVTHSQAIDVEITGLPRSNPPFKILNRDRLRGDDSASRYTVEADAILKKIEAMREAYNYDGSDSQSDYFDVNYYGDTSFSTDLEHEDRESFERERADAERVVAAVTDPSRFAVQEHVAAEAAATERAEAQVLHERRMARLARQREERSAALHEIGNARAALEAAAERYVAAKAKLATIDAAYANGVAVG